LDDDGDELPDSSDGEELEEEKLDEQSQPNQGPQQSFIQMMFDS